MQFSRKPLQTWLKFWTILKIFLKSKITYGLQSNQKIEAFLKSKISYGAQSNQKIETY